MLILAFEANSALSCENETKIVKITHSDVWFVLVLVLWSIPFSLSQESLGAHDLLIALNVAERINIVRETSTRTFLLYSYSLLRYRLLLISFGNLNSREELNSEDEALPAYWLYRWMWKSLFPPK